MRKRVYGYIVNWMICVVVLFSYGYNHCRGFSPFNFSVSRYQTYKRRRYVTLSHEKMHSCLLSYCLLEQQKYDLSFSDTLTTLEIKTCVALEHGTACFSFFLELGAANDC